MPSSLLLLKQIERRIELGLQPLLDEFGLSIEQWRVMAVLHAEPGQPMSILAEAAVLPAASLTRHVDKLVERGLVLRRIHPDDRRIVTALPVGGTVADRIAAAHARPRGGARGLLPDGNTNVADRQHGSNTRSRFLPFGCIPAGSRPPEHRSLQVPRSSAHAGQTIARPQRHPEPPAQTAATRETLKDYTLRFAPRSYRKWSTGVVAVSRRDRLADFAIGANIGISYGTTNALWGSRSSRGDLRDRPAARVLRRALQHRPRPDHPRQRFEYYGRS